MHENPFSPIFGGKPNTFFGRKDLLDRFDLAMRDTGSDDRALFVTGARGSGKTALVEQLSTRARTAGKRVIDLGPEDTVSLLLRGLLSHDEVTKTISPQASVSFMGMGAGASAGSVSKTTHYDRADLTQAFIDACAREKHGILVTIDEVQKVAEEDMSAICNAFQMASRKGCDAMIVVAGLPYAHGAIIRYKGCTFMRRAAHEEIGLLSYGEAHDAFADTLRKVEGLSINDDLLEQLVRSSMGQPYLIQLLGYHLVLESGGTTDSRALVTHENIATCTHNALLAYERRALLPMVDELSSLEQEYLTAMSNLMAERGEDTNVIRTEEVAQALGKEQRQLSQVRDRLIGLGIIAAPQRGSLMFCIPHLRTYLRKDRGSGDVVARALSWGV